MQVFQRRVGGKEEREREFEFASFAKMWFFFLLVCEKLWLLWKSFMPFRILHDFFDVLGCWIFSFLFSSIASSNKRVTNSSLEKQKNKGRKNLRTKGRIQKQPSVKEKSVYIVSEYEWKGNKFELSESPL
jgi:hypothetical protein